MWEGGRTSFTIRLRVRAPALALRRHMQFAHRLVDLIVFVHADVVSMYIPRTRLVHTVGACAYTDTPSLSTHAVFVHPYVASVYIPRHRLVHRIGASACTGAPNVSTHAMCVCPDVVSVHTPEQSLVHQLGACVDTDTSSLSIIQCLCTHTLS